MNTNAFSYQVEKDLADFWVPVSQIIKKTAD
jgi:hypothetical protein